MLLLGPFRALEGARRTSNLVISAIRRLVRVFDYRQTDRVIDLASQLLATNYRGLRKNE